jgi:hypothetical protein
MTDKAIVKDMFAFKSPYKFPLVDFKKIRDSAFELANLINDQDGAYREKSLALDKLRECVFYVEASSSVAQSSIESYPKFMR